MIKINKVCFSFKHYKKGWKFIRDNYDENILLSLKNNPSIDLSFSKLESIPKELNLTQSQKINLSNNSIVEINENDFIYFCQTLRGFYQKHP